MSDLRKRIYALVEPVSYDDISAQRFDWFDRFIVVLIALNILAVFLASIEQIAQDFERAFYIFAVFSVGVFSIEYVMRLWSCTVNPKYAQPILGRLLFVISPMAIVDLLAIAPFYLPMLIHADLRFLRILRLFRLFRIFKFGRYSESLKTIGNVLRARRSELYITVFVIFILLILSSSLLYYAEHDAQHEKFPSIPGSLWWSVVTLTTVGYGDVFPITPLGKIFGAIISFLGIGLFALPAGILGAGFLDEIRNKRCEKAVCPHCGKEIGQ